MLQGGDLQELKAQWVKETQLLHSFLDKFIDRFGSKIMGERDDSPEWKLYLAKSEEYNAYNRAIKSVDYFIQKEKTLRYC